MSPLFKVSFFTIVRYPLAPKVELLGGTRSEFQVRCRLTILTRS